jgi:hypothetical protein
VSTFRLISQSSISAANGVGSFAFRASEGAQCFTLASNSAAVMPESRLSIPKRRAALSFSFQGAKADTSPRRTRQHGASFS